VIPPPARSRVRGSGPLPSHDGISVVELLVVLAMLAAATAVAAPGAIRLRAALSVRSAAAQVRVAFLQARAYAIARGRFVGIKFRKNGDRHEWALYVDGNGNGIRTVDIQRGVDRPLGISFPWNRNDVMPGILKGNRVPDPGDPGRALDHLDDPIRFNSSDICSFSPAGESTPGSIYLWDGHDRMAVVRVFGRTAKVRTLYHWRGEREWKQ
jgi:type II secretory pathway pseudopilin PulG